MFSQNDNAQIEMYFIVKEKNEEKRLSNPVILTKDAFIIYPENLVAIELWRRVSLDNMYGGKKTNNLHILCTVEIKNKEELNTYLEKLQEEILSYEQSLRNVKKLLKISHQI